MTEPAAPKRGRYLYAVIAGSSERTCEFSGIDGSPVYTVGSGGVSAVVSDVINQRLRPERRHLAAHQQVLKRLMEKSTVLPMAFGTIADSPQAVSKILSLNREDLHQQLSRVKDKLEMGVSVKWDVLDIYDYLVNMHHELRLARDQVFGARRQPTQDEKMEVGRLFDRILNQDRQTYADRVEEILSPRCFEIKHNPSRNEREVMNLACLVGRDKRGEFEAGVLEAARLFDDHFAIDYNGPWAPHNFVEVDLKL